MALLELSSSQATKRLCKWWEDRYTSSYFVLGLITACPQKTLWSASACRKDMTPGNAPEGFEPQASGLRRARP
jgi:hypothetical protein